MINLFCKEEYFLNKAKKVVFRQESKGRKKPSTTQALKILKTQYLLNMLGMASISFISVYLINDSYYANRELFLSIFIGFFVSCSVMAIFDFFRFIKINTAISKCINADKLFEGSK